ncbi:MAG: hypothetical protein K2X98_05740 [Alphaproteobacteria bacterium]|nr:hypothetical protein [Alphaproteobacteria bacterium]
MIDDIINTGGMSFLSTDHDVYLTIRQKLWNKGFFRMASSHQKIIIKKVLNQGKLFVDLSNPFSVEDLINEKVAIF